MKIRKITKNSISKFKKNYGLKRIPYKEWTNGIFISFMSKSYIIVLVNASCDSYEVKAKKAYRIHRDPVYLMKDVTDNYEYDKYNFDPWYFTKKYPKSLDEILNNISEEVDIKNSTPPDQAYELNSRIIGEDPDEPIYGRGSNKEFSRIISDINLLNQVFSETPKTAFQVKSYEMDNKDAVTPAYKLGYDLGYDNYPESKTRIYEDNLYLIEHKDKDFGSKSDFVIGINNGRLMAIAERTV